MKKWLVGSVVGAIVLFIWQFLSWTVIGLHDKEFRYTPQQDQVISTLSSVLKEDAQFMVPTLPPGSTMKEHAAFGESLKGKPWAMVTYHSSYDPNMTISMLRGFFVDLVVALLLIFILSKNANRQVSTAIFTTLAVGFIAWLWYPYTQNIWFQAPGEILTGALIDWLVAYTLVGAWLGWWLRRN